jgi:hypothetical protein
MMYGIDERAAGRGYFIVYDTVYTILMSFTVLFWYDYVIQADGHSAGEILTFLASVAVAVFIAHTDRQGREIAAIFFLAVISGLFIFRNSEGMSELETSAAGLFPVAILVLLCFAFIRFARKRPVIRIFFVSAVIIMLLFSMLSGIDMTSADMAAACTFILLNSAELIQTGSAKKGYTQTEAHMAAIMPFVLPFMLIIVFLPAPKDPFDWKFVKAVYMELKEDIITASQHIIRQGEEDYVPAYSGFSDNGTLFSAVDPQKNEVMTVENSSDQEYTLYLAGKIFDHFDGREWEQSADPGSNDRILDTIETMYAIGSREPGMVSDYCMVSDIRVTYRYFSSSYIFSPLKTFVIKRDNRDMGLHTEGADLISPEKLSYNDSYEIRYMMLNSRNDDFYDIFAERSVPDRLHLRKLFDEYGGESYGEDYAVTLDRHRKQIIRTYLNKIDLSDEVMRYRDRITEGTDTDAEKLKAIEKALSQMEYNTSPGALPENVNDGSSFLDYFLLSGRKGFCSYYATAFVLLANSEGIPARYVQGYIVPVKRRTTVKVTSDMAHAWPEAYIDGFGWMSFEPTPGYTGRNGAGWEMSSNADTEMQAAVLPEMPETAADTQQVTDTGKGRKRFNPAIPAVIAVIAALMLLILFALERIVLRHRFKAMSVEKKFICRYERNNRILDHLGFSRAESETLCEFHDRCSVYFGEAHTEYINCYAAKIFGNREILPEDYAAAVFSEKSILEEAQKKGIKRLFLIRIWLFVTNPE